MTHLHAWPFLPDSWYLYEFQEKHCSCLKTALSQHGQYFDIKYLVFLQVTKSKLFYKLLCLFKYCHWLLICPLFYNAQSLKFAIIHNSWSLVHSVCGSKISNGINALRATLKHWKKSFGWSLSCFQNCEQRSMQLLKLYNKPCNVLALHSNCKVCYQC